MKQFKPKPLMITADLPGLSLKSIQEHYKLYEGYVKKTNEIREKIAGADKTEANAVYSMIAELKRQESFARNGMKLHEVYFANLGGNGTPEGALLRMIEKSFGSYDTWKNDFIATGMSARGWAILAFDWNEDALINFAMDTQNMGAIVSVTPLIAMDMYEHAFFMDYGVNKKSYIEAFFQNLNWNFINTIVEQYNLEKVQK
jgi:Fe-Mn family superoxide dismutase